MLDPVSHRLIASESGKRPLVLSYHAIDLNPGTEAPPWTISLRRFQSHLDLLEDYGWTTVTVSDLTAGLPLRERTVAITFDDGYVDTVRAAEELTDRSMTATWFITTGPLLGKSSLPLRKRPCLRRNELREMDIAGFAVGSHTQNHPRLTDLDDDHLQSELAGSRTELEDVLGHRVVGIAYPFGLYDNRILAAAQDAGYTYGCTMKSGWAMHEGDPMQIRRITVFTGDTAATLARKLAFSDNDGSLFRTVRYLMSRTKARLVK